MITGKKYSQIESNFDRNYKNVNKIVQSIFFKTFSIKAQLTTINNVSNKI